MKVLLSSLILMMSVSAQADVSTAEQSLEALNGADCLNQLEKTLHNYTHPSMWAKLAAPLTTTAVSYAVRSAVLNNTRVYKNATLAIIGNLKRGDSNEQIYAQIRNNLARHKQSNGVPGDITGYTARFARATAVCIEKNLDFSGDQASQLATARAAINKIVSIEKAVQ